MGKLGIVGLLLVLTALLTVLAGLALRIRGPDRALYAAIFAAAIPWALARSARHLAAARSRA